MAKKKAATKKKPAPAQAGRSVSSKRRNNTAGARKKRPVAVPVIQYINTPDTLTNGTNHRIGAALSNFPSIEGASLDQSDANASFSNPKVISVVSSLPPSPRPQYVSFDSSVFNYRGPGGTAYLTITVYSGGKGYSKTSAPVTYKKNQISATIS